MLLADLIIMVMPSSIVVALLSVLISVKVHRLFGTCLSRWMLIFALSIAIYALSSALSAFSEAALALADVSIIAAGFAAYAASRWLKGTFEVGATHDR